VVYIKSVKEIEMTTLTLSSAVPASVSVDADTHFQAYLDYLHHRNGSHFQIRDRRMSTVFDQSEVRSRELIDSDRFNRNYRCFSETAISPEELALLSFVKINAGEAYGVEVTANARKKKWEGSTELVHQVEQLVMKEEDYHTRLLVGAAQHYDGLTIENAWSPPWPLRLLIGALVHVPQTLFHPVLIGAEIAGLHAFNWLLNRIQSLFKDEVLIRESLEARLIEILTDELGHVAFNRILVGPKGRAVGGWVAKQVTRSHRIMSKELVALGFDDQAMAAVEDFDLDQLPETVLRNGFFV